MLEIRWHARAGQGAVTGAKGLGSIVANRGKNVQSFAFYGSAKRGAAMTAYNRIDDEVVVDNSKHMTPDYVLVLDPGIVFSSDFTQNTKDTTKFIITSHLSKDEILQKLPNLQDKQDRLYVLDCFAIAKATIKKPIPNTPMLGAFIKVSSMFELEEFQNEMKAILKKLPQEIIDANMIAIKQAYEQVS